MSDQTATDDDEYTRDEIRRRTFDPKLDGMGLTQRQIDKYSLDELKLHLITITRAMEHPEEFGTVGVTVTETGGVKIADTAFAQLEMGVLPLLQERRNLILNRIKNLEGDQKINSLRTLVESVSDPATRAGILKELDEIREQSRIQAEEVATQNATIQKLQSEGRIRPFKGYFPREPVATLVGAVILIVYAVARLVIPFVQPNGPNVFDFTHVDSIMLLLLGYFFGQGVTKVA